MLGLGCCTTDLTTPACDKKTGRGGLNTEPTFRSSNFTVYRPSGFSESEYDGQKQIHNSNEKEKLSTILRPQITDHTGEDWVIRRRPALCSHSRKRYLLTVTLLILAVSTGLHPYTPTSGRNEASTSNPSGTYVIADKRIAYSPNFRTFNFRSITKIIPLS